MELKIDSKIAAYAGFVLMVLGLLIPYVKTPFGGAPLLLKMGALGELSGMAYVIAIVAIAVAAYAGYIAFTKPADYMKAAIAGAAGFLILFIGFYIMRSATIGDAGMFGELAKMAFRMGFATWMFLLGAAAFYFAARGFTPISVKAPEVKKEE